MIKTASEYNASKAFIDKDLELYDYELSERMVSGELNLFFQDTEYLFNVLYEKLRTLEDLTDYLEFYSDAKINNTRKYISEKELVLKGLASKLSESGAVSVPLTWETNPLVNASDRNGSELPTAELTSDYCVTSSSVLTHTQKPLTITKHTDTQCFSDNLKQCVQDDYYITEYNLDKPKEISEFIEIKIADPDGFDFFDYRPINCNVEYLGKNHLNHIVLKLTAANMYKEQENFDYKTFKGSALNNVTTSSFTGTTGKTIYENEQERYGELDEELSLGYLSSVKDYWLVNELTGDRKEVQNAAE